MKKLLVLAATFAATSAMAAVKIEVRSDYMNVPKYDNETTGENGGSSVFAPSVARLYLSGNVGDALIDSGWNLRAFTPEFGAGTPGGTNTTLFKTMTVDSFVDHLTIEKTMDNWTFKAGKLWMNVGGFERRNIWHGETYLSSLANGGTGGTASTGAATRGTVTTPANMSGFSAAYAINPDNKLEVQVANAVNSQTISGTTVSLDRRHTYGLAYMGSFLEKMVQPYLSYTLGSADTNAAGHELEYVAAGLRLAPVENLGLDVEYLKNQDTNSTNDGENSTQSMIVEARYNMNGWVPLVKYEMSEDKVARGATFVSETNFKRDAFSVGLEMVPKAEEAFRYHIAYTSVADKDIYNGTTNDGEMTQNMITVGMKYTGDIVK